MKNNLEEVWNQEYRDFMLSFYPESSPLVSTWEIYRMAKIKSQKEIKNLLELTETLNQIRDNLQDENRKLQQELQKTRSQLAKCEKSLMKVACFETHGENKYISHAQAYTGVANFARQYFQDKDKQGE